LQLLPFVYQIGHGALFALQQAPENSAGGTEPHGEPEQACGGSGYFETERTVKPFLVSRWVQLKSDVPR
jgi:hypothetical protein